MNSVQSCELEAPDANARIAYTIVPEFAPSDPKSTILRSPSGSPGVYRVTFVLAVPGKDMFRTNLDIPQVMAAGDSQLLMPKDRLLKCTIVAGTESAEIVFFSNTNGNLGRAQIRVTAANFAEAERVAHDIVLPNLSWWSYRFDVAIDVSGYEVLEENTDVNRWVFGFLGKIKPLTFSDSEPMTASTPEYRALFAAYREALNATNPFYQFLCYYRVVEGVCKLRNSRRATVIAAGQTPVQPTEQLPPHVAGLAVHALVKEFFKPYLGKKYTWILDQLRPVVRNALAHLDPTGDSLVADKFEDVSRCEQAVPVVKYLAREMLRNELAVDPTTAGFKVL